MGARAPGLVSSRQAGGRGFPLLRSDYAKKAPLLASGMARSNRVNLSRLAERLEAAVLPPRSSAVWTAFVLQPPDVDPPERGWTGPG